MAEAGMGVVEVISAAAGLVGILEVEEHQGMGKALQVPASRYAETEGE